MFLEIGEIAKRAHKISTDDVDADFKVLLGTERDQFMVSVLMICSTGRKD